MEQTLSIAQRILKMAERIFLKEQVEKREHQLKELHNEKEEEPVRGRRERRERRSLCNCFKGWCRETP